ncbi:MAG: DUF2207 domain-containing protein, partial [Devosia sp.]
MRFLRGVFAALVLVALAAVPALAAEEITHFDSQTVLRTDGTVDVTETIDVNAEGDRIRHGIFRNIFTILRNADGSKFYSSLNVLGVTRDGQREAFTVEGIPNGQQVKIGDADTFVDPGPHSYVIHYTLSRMARFFPDHDELYWNVTGNFWDFPLLKATATITLPEGARIDRTAAYTGPVGSTAEDATSAKQADNVVTFATTKPLNPGDGLTIAVAFQKGIVTPPAGAGQGLDWISDHRDALLPPILLLIVLGYNFLAWNRVGRDPRKGTIIPLFHPPEGLSPALVHWVHRMGWQKNGWTAITALIFDLGVKGLVTVDNTAKKLTVASVGDQPVTLPTGESQLNSYFRSQHTITIDKTTGPDLDRKRREVISAIESENRGAYFNNNISFIVLGALITAICLGIMVWLDVLDVTWLVAGVVGGIVIGVIVGIFRGAIGGRSPFGLIFGVIWLGIFGFNALAALGRTFTSDLPVNGPALAAVSMVLVTVFFAFIMRAPTVAGRKLMDQIDGFLMYLNTAEKNRLNMPGEPVLTIKRFEAILPFAIALGVEKLWTDKFNAALAAGMVPDATGAYFGPAWYTGGNFSDSRSLSNNIAAISSGMAAAMASAVPAQSSS